MTPANSVGAAGMPPRRVPGDSLRLIHPMGGI